MSAERRFRLVWALLLAASVAAVYLPLAAVAAELPRAGAGWIELAMPSGRRLALLASSALLAASVACAGLALALPAALWAALNRSGRAHAVRWMMAAMIVVPPYIHAAAWSGFGGALRAASGWLAAAWVETVAFLPAAFWLALLAFESLDAKLIEAACLHAPPSAAFRKVVLPLAVPPLAAGAGFLFVLALTDYTVPSLFSCPTYALDVFSQFSGSANAARALLASLPLIALAAAAVGFAQAPLRNAALRPCARSLPAQAFPPWLRKAGSGCGWLLLAAALLPLVSLGLTAASPANLATAASDARGDLAYSFATAAAAAAAGLPLALAGGLALARLRSRAAWILTAFPLAVPAPLVGIGLVSVWNRPWADPFSAAAPATAALARFLPVASILLAAFLRRMDPALLDAARIFQSRPAQGVLRIGIPLLRPGLLAAAATIFALALGELGATLIVVPPGFSTMSIRIYNYLHYGSSEAVASLCLISAAATLAGGWLLTRARRA